MLQDKIQDFSDQYKFKVKDSVQNKICTTIQQQELINIINIEFQKTHIKKLYTNPKWTERTFWVALMAVETETELELPEILQSARQYLNDNKLPIPPINWGYWVPNASSQRDNMKSLRIYIKNSPGDINQIEQHAAENGISGEVFQTAIKQMKKEGSIFETRDGILRCI